MDDSVSARRFTELRECFRSVGDRLNDLQLLELADLYHDILRSRRPREALLPPPTGPKPSP